MIKFKKGKFYEVYRLNGRGEKVNRKEAECLNIDSTAHIATFKINGRKEIKYNVAVEKLYLPEVQKTDLLR